MLGPPPLEDGVAVGRSRLEITTDVVVITRSPVPHWPQVVWTREKAAIIRFRSAVVDTSRHRRGTLSG
jgi:hypothetical protein